MDKILCSNWLAGRKDGPILIARLGCPVMAPQEKK